MKSIIKVLLTVLILGILMTSVTFADNTVPSVIPGQAAVTQFDKIYYQVAKRVYDNYMKGITVTEIALKGVDFVNNDPVTGTDKVGTVLVSFDGLNATTKVTKVGDVTQIVVTVEQLDMYINSKELDTELDRLIAETEQFSSVRDKLAYLNDEVAKISRYENEEDIIVQSAEGALIKRRGNCTGYTNLVDEFAKRLGIKHYFIDSASHMASVVYVDGQWYLWDLTYNMVESRYGLQTVYYADKSSGKTVLVKGPTQREWFLVPLDGEQIQTYLRISKMNEIHLGSTAMFKAIRYPEMSDIDLSLGDLEVEFVKQEEQKQPEQVQVKEEVKPVQTSVEPAKNEAESMVIDNKGNLIIGGVKQNLGPVIKLQAKLNKSKVIVNGKAVTFEAYTIGGNNYFKLRDIAMAINGSTKQFSVGYDTVKRAVSLVTGEEYVKEGGELEISGVLRDREAVLSKVKLYVNGKEVKVTTYTIRDNNYLKIRELGEVINFGVDWDRKSNTIIIDTSKVYTD